MLGNVSVGTDVVKGKALIEAVLVKDFEKATKLINEGAYLDLIAKVTKHGLLESALHLATKAGQTAIVQLMILKGANVNVTSKDRTALHVAALEQKTDIMALLLDAGANVNAQDGFGCTSLETAARRESLVQVNMLLAKGANPNIENGCQETPLHYVGANFEIAQALLGSGAIVTGQDSRGRSVLHRAVEFGNLKVISLLLDAGADLKMVDQDGCTVLHLLAHGRGSAELVKFLIDRGADVKLKSTKYMQTALHSAAFRDSGMVNALLQGGAEIDAVDGSGNTALLNAVNSGSIQSVKVLLDNGAAVNIANSDQITPLHEGCRFQKVKIVDLLLQHGADVDAKDYAGNTPLHDAVDGRNKKSSQIVKLLLNKNAKCDVKNNDGETPLCAAVNGCDIESVKLLIAAGADVNLVFQETSTKQGELIVYLAKYIEIKISKAVFSAPNLRLRDSDIAALKENAPYGFDVQEILHTRFPEHFTEPKPKYSEDLVDFMKYYGEIDDDSSEDAVSESLDNHEEDTLIENTLIQQPPVTAEDVTVAEFIRPHSPAVLVSEQGQKLNNESAGTQQVIIASTAGASASKPAYDC